MLTHDPGDSDTATPTAAIAPENATRSSVYTGSLGRPGPYIQSTLTKSKPHSDHSAASDARYAAAGADGAFVPSASPLQLQLRSRRAAASAVYGEFRMGVRARTALTGTPRMSHAPSFRLSACTSAARALKPRGKRAGHGAGRPHASRLMSSGPSPSYQPPSITIVS